MHSRKNFRNCPFWFFWFRTQVLMQILLFRKKRMSDIHIQWQCYPNAISCRCPLSYSGLADRRAEGRKGLFLRMSFSSCKDPKGRILLLPNQRFVETKTLLEYHCQSKIRRLCLFKILLSTEKSATQTRILGRQKLISPGLGSSSSNLRESPLVYHA